MTEKASNPLVVSQVVILATCMASLTPVSVCKYGETKTGVVIKLELEDGSGDRYNLYFQDGTWIYVDLSVKMYVSVATTPSRITWR